MPSRPKWRPRGRSRNVPIEGHRLAPTRAIDIEGINVIEWNPNADGSGEATQVWMVLDVHGHDVPIVIRFKDAPGLDDVIAALTRHRIGVFGEYRS